VFITYNFLKVYNSITSWGYNSNNEVKHYDEHCKSLNVPDSPDKEDIEVYPEWLFFLLELGILRHS